MGRENLHVFGAGALSINPKSLLHAFAKYGLRPMGPGTLGVLARATKGKRPQCHSESSLLGILGPRYCIVDLAFPP